MGFGPPTLDSAIELNLFEQLGESWIRGRFDGRTRVDTTMNHDRLAVLRRVHDILCKLPELVAICASSDEATTVIDAVREIRKVLAVDKELLMRSTALCLRHCTTPDSISPTSERSLLRRRDCV